MESEIRDVFRHCLRFPVPISASVVADEPVDTANEKRCVTVLTRKFSGVLSCGFIVYLLSCIQLNYDFMVIAFQLSFSVGWSQCDLERGVKLRFSQRWTLLCKHDTVEHVLPSGTSSHTEKE